MRGEPEISVVIPVRDGEATLPALLESLASQTLAAARFEVVVVDNGSHDATAHIARARGVQVVHEPVPNRSRARNRGAAAARADLLSFTDADCVAAPDWLEALVERRPPEPLVAGPVLVTTSESPNRVERFEALWRFSQEHWVRQGWAATANLCVARHAFEDVGGFDTAYRHIGEDADFCLRAGRAGHRLGWCPDAVVTHGAEHELAPLLRRAFFHGYGAHQCLQRIGVGHQAWRDPLPAVAGDAALRSLGVTPARTGQTDWRPMARLARAAYAARVLGSLWAELQLSRARGRC